MPELLIELFSEEIPARMQARAAQDLKARVTGGLVEAGLSHAAAQAFSTPRRLVLAVEGLPAASPTRREERKGPRADAPQKAIEGFLRGAGVMRDRIETRDTPRGRVLFAVLERPGRPAADIVAEVLAATIRNFPWPKSMRWGSGTLRWVRPLHGVLCILHDETGARVVPMQVDGIVAADSTEGHRFMAPNRFSVASFEDYAAKLVRAHVILSAEERAARIRADADSLAFAAGLELVEDKSLLAEVAGLVEWPVVLMGKIGPEFLSLPAEVLQTSMREHQKFFSVRNPRTGRIERFVTVANIETPDHGAAILAGNRKVLAARLSDARFFWDNDLRTIRERGLEGMAEGLALVTFHNKLGSQADRVKRIEALAREIAPLVGADADLAGQAARVAKADLQSQMVGEFPELQGVMGRYYAEVAGLDPSVAAACEEHYKPLGPSDAVPTAPVSVAVALADKIDTLCGFWAIDEKPTGSKDPYALRRAALGVIRLVLGNGVRTHLLKMLPQMIGKQIVTSSLFHESEKRVFKVGEEAEKAADLLSFLHDRLKVHLKGEGIRHDVIDACLAMEGNDDLTLLVHRATALSDFLKTDDGENLVQGFRRVGNILTQAEERDGVEYSYGAEAKFAETDSERALFAALAGAGARIAPAMKAEDFAGAMAAMAALRAPIDRFFEDVQVNADNAVLRRNRLNLLHDIRGLCSRVADLSRIEASAPPDTAGGAAPRTPRDY